ncbi:hypothetical protein CDL15_Pgr010190 [Punica granatum]|uniref:Glycosyl hydrolase family 13 catalytic domain-containing protein n=1 Tax=Punica granatum TaxID=22663 RepID=A0A218XQS6_PUNGR|nr:hypothetical protein CDL15_Pgr010190 [Punica granatum]PKH47711.1 hypothetical protein CRG98_050462 [Punica granatum]
MATLPTPIATRPCCLHCGTTDASKLVSSSHYSYRTKLPQSFERVDTKQKLIHRGSVQDLVCSPHRNLLKVSAMTGVSVEDVDQTYTLVTHKLEKGSSYLFRTEVGGQVKVSVTQKNAKYPVFIEVSSLRLPSSTDRLILAWGVYRSDSTCTQTLDFGSLAPDAEPLVRENPLDQISDSEYALELEFDRKQIPFFLSFLLKSSSGLEIRSHTHMKFCIPVGLGRGRPSPLGLSFPAGGSISFAVFSRNAEGVVLCLYDDASADQPTLELDLDPYVNRTGDIWHVSLENPGNFTAYGYRFRGRNNDHFDKGRIILDPYAKIIEKPKNPGAAALTSYRCLGLLSQVKPFNWAGDVRPNLSMERLMVYRLNVKRFTEHKSSQLPADIAGTFSGLAEKIDHFKDLGVNAVLMEPIFPRDEQKGSYMPFHFFSPMSIYGPSSNQISAINSLKDAVKRLHSSGIEVFLEVVFTETADSGALQGIDDPSYYHLSGPVKMRRALNCNYPIVQQFILDSLRHWVIEFHIDGFCFMNASSLLRGFHGESLSRPPLVEAIAFDPILSRTKIIADSWDPINAAQKDVEFPHWKRWAEMNSKFCIDIRNFLRGGGLLSDLATRLCGNGDLFFDGRGPAFSFNFIARNFGLSLVDLVSFSKGELATEFSWNCGEEGPTNKIAVLERRLKQIRNFLFILYLSLGVPVLNMGDECGHSAGGSPTYGARKPFDWTTLKAGFGMQTSQFISFLSSFRRRRGDLLQNRNFLKEESINWHGSDQAPPKWGDPTSRFLAVNLKPEQDTKTSLEGPKTSEGPGDLFIAFNGADQAERVILPPSPKGMGWNRLVDTALHYPGFFLVEGEPVIEQMAGLVSYEMKSHSCALFEATALTG